MAMARRDWVNLDRQVAAALERSISLAERRILTEYSVAFKQIRGEMGRLYEKVNQPDGKLTLAEMTKYNRLNSLDKQIAGIMNDRYRVIVGEMKKLPPALYDETFFRYAWAFDQNSQAALTWGTISPEVIEEISSNPLDLISQGQLRVAERNRIRSAISQGLLQGKSFTKMMAGVRKAMGSNASDALRIARTEGQRTQNAATDAIYAKAQEQGVEGEVIWDATLDGVTRQTHRAKDGEVRAPDGLFSPLGGVRVRAPVSPGLPANEAINCRCRLRFQVEGYAPQLRRTRDQGVIPYTTYDNWKPGLNARGRNTAAVGAPPGFVPAKTLEEANEWARDNMGIRGNSSELNLDAMNMVNHRLSELKKDYKADTLKFYGDERGSSAYASANNTIMSFNANRFNNPSGMVAKLTKDVEAGWHPAMGNTVKSVIDHEFAHVLTSGDLITFGGVPNTEFKVGAQAIKRAYNKSVKAGGPVISDYAKKNMDEFVAESFSMALNNPAPNPFAKDVFDLMRRTYGR
jgi:hypothetical protein